MLTVLPSAGAAFFGFPYENHPLPNFRPGAAVGLDMLARHNPAQSAVFRARTCPGSPDIDPTPNAVGQSTARKE